MSSCPNGLCQSFNTELKERTCRLEFNKGKIVDCYITDYYLCHDCDSFFRASVQKVLPWHLRFKEYKQKMKSPPTKDEIIEELFSEVE